MESLLFFTTLPERVVVIWPLTQFCWQGFLTALLLSILHDTATANAIVHSAPLSRSGVIPSAALLRHTLASHSTAPFVWRASFIDSCASGCCCRPPVWTQRPSGSSLSRSAKPGAHHLERTAHPERCTRQRTRQAKSVRDKQGPPRSLSRALGRGRPLRIFCSFL